MGGSGRLSKEHRARAFDLKFFPGFECLPRYGRIRQGKHGKTGKDKYLDQHSRTPARWIFILIATCVHAGNAWAAGVALTFHIPAGQASQTLQQFYLQSQVRVLYLSDTVKGVATPEVTGQFETADALARLLQGTGLTFEFDGPYSAVIKVASRVLGKSHAAITSSSGDGPLIPPIFDASSDTKLEEVLVTGSLIHGVLDISSPLVLVDRREMKKTGYATVQDTVRALPMAATVTRGEVFGGVGNINRGSGINLRGLGDGSTLVLVNGRRQPMAGLQADFVDVSNIPWSMVDHIEVLPDGGSALYGSDAIAGVVNIILRQNMEGAETQVRFGTARDGATESTMAQLVGHNWASGHWLAAYQYYHRTSLAAADRGYTANADKRMLGGSDFRSVNSNPGNILNPQTLQPAFAIPQGQDGTSLTAGDLLPGVVNYRNQFADVELLPDVRTHSVYFTGSQDLSEHTALFAEGRFGQRDIRQQPLTADVSPFAVPATNPFFVDPFGGAPFVVMAYDFSKDIGPYRVDGRTRDYVGTLGLKSKFGASWQASLSVSYGEESLDAMTHGEVNTSALNAALADPNPATAFNPFGDGSHNNPATLAAIEAVSRFNAISKIPSVQLQADGSLFDLPSGAVKMAIGAEYREESLIRETPDVTTSLRPLTRTSLSRSIAATFTELSVPLMGDAINPHAVPKLELSLAGRYEHYNDFGNTFNPKIGLRWTPLTSIKLRTSWGTSFKAPNMTDLDDAKNLSGIVSLSDPRSPTGRSTVLTIQGGNPDLKEERATTLTAGIDLAPEELPGFQLSLTGYSIKYKDQVIQPGPTNPFFILQQEDQWAAVITRNPSQSQINAICSSPQFQGNPAQCVTNPPTVFVDIRKHNLAITKVKGLDLTLNQAFNTAYGHFNLGLNGSYLFHFDRAFTKTAPSVDIVDTVGNPSALRLRGTVEWHQHGEKEGGLGASLTTNYAGSYSDPDSLTRDSVGAWTTFDLGLSYRIGRGSDWLDDTELVLNVVNVLNKDPPFVDRDWGYDIVNAQPAGRVVNAYFSKRW